VAAAQNLDQGKPAPKLFAESCVSCHRSPRGLAKGRFHLTLYLFLQKHYSSGSSSAWALTSYLESIDSGKRVAAKPRRNRRVAVTLVAAAGAGAGAIGPRSATTCSRLRCEISPRRHLFDLCRPSIVACAWRGVTTMVVAELKTKVEKYETKASRCEQQAQAATDKAEQTFYEVLAGYYGSLATDFPQDLEKRVIA
jgi:hypothetical protein